MAKRIPQEVIDSIRKLRQKGLSLNEIKKLHPIGYGSVFRYIKDIEILPQYRKSWLDKRGGSRRRKVRLEAEAYEKSKKVVSSLTEREKLLFLAALYWGEGTKKDFSLTNSDPEMVKVFTKGLKEILKIPSSRLRVSLRIYEDLDKDRCLAFWSKVIGIDPEQFVSVIVLRGKKVGKLNYGICRVRILKGGNVLKYMAALKKRVTEVF